MKEDKELSEKQSSCKKCGKCCLKGGPSFHHEDRDLIDKGVIPGKNLYTIRAGELAFDNIAEEVLPSKFDIVKIKGVGNTWTCVFFDIKKNICTIYENRPAECRALKCWDTKEITSIYSENRLLRKDLLGSITGLWEMIEEHNEKCSFFRIVEIIEKEDSFDEIIDIIKYDLSLRKLLVEKKMAQEDMLDFLFGRPIYKTISGYGVEIIQQGSEYKIKRIP